MKLLRRWRILGALMFAAILLSIVFVWNIGAVLVAPSNHPIGKPPPGLPVENVEFPSASGATLHGWLVAGQPGQGAVVLMHGIHADRTTLAARAEFLSRAGYAVLLFDFQGHGESRGKEITFGYLESRDATAAVNFIHQKLPGEKVGVLGISLGAASALLADPPLPVHALVLESSYPTLYQATEDRLGLRFGLLGRLATPLLTCQLKPRLGFSPDDLNPLACARNIHVPKFFLAGTLDHDTTIEEAKALFAAAAEPKQAWWIDGAGHEDLHRFAGREYETRVLAFLVGQLSRSDSVQPQMDTDEHR
jgi:alpha-beta hydrolase superfamily lysophospholipase